MTPGLIVAASVATIAVAADCVTTEIALHRGFVEGNPIMSRLFGRHVAIGSAVLSVVLISIVLWAASVDPIPNAQIALYFLWAFAVYRGALAVVNFLKLRKKESK